MSRPMIGSPGDSKGLLAEPIRELSLEDLASLFARAAKPKEQWRVGLELELLAFFEANLSPVPHGTLAQVIEAMGREKGMSEEREGGVLVGLSGHGENVSLEPGGQLEFASRPRGRLADLKADLLAHASILGRVGADRGLGFWALGLQPFVDRDHAPYMPKPRYERMRAYLGPRGARALDMMHLTGSVQCTVDYSSEEDMKDKIRAAAKSSPFVSALVAASPFSGGRPNGFKSVRYQVWLETDDERCGIWPEMVDGEGMGFERYLRRALSTTAMFFVRDGQYRACEPRPFQHYADHGFEGSLVTVADLVDHLTTFFPEVRPKGYVELRGADCVLPEEAVAVAAFWHGLLDDDDARGEALERLRGLDFEALRGLQAEVAVRGLDARCSLGRAGSIVSELVSISRKSLEKDSESSAACLAPLVRRADRQESPADELLARAARSSIQEAVMMFRLPAAAGP